MDANERDESRNRRREETLARRVGEALDQLHPGGTGDCPDAEIIAAYAEQALAPSESAAWEGHFASCARCRKILRVLAASADTPLAEKEVAHLGQLVSAVSAPAEVAGKSQSRVPRRIADWRVRWLAPALGAAAVLAVWFVVRPPWRAPSQNGDPTLVAQAPREEAPASPAPAPADQAPSYAPPQDLKSKSTASPDLPATKSAPPSAISTPLNGRSNTGSEGEVVSGGVQAMGADALRKKESPAIPANKPATSAMASPAAPPPVAEAQAVTNALQSDTTTGQRNRAAPNQNDELDAAKDAGGASADKQAGAPDQAANALALPQARAKAAPIPQRQREFSALKSAEKVAGILTAPSGTVLWLAGKGGSIQRSTDAGRSWISQQSPSQDDWLAGAAVSDTACWLVGRNGAIARTTDGQQWGIVAPSAQSAGPAGKLPDWIAVTATDAVTATITSVDGRKFATADGGKTWQAQ